MYGRNVHSVRARGFFVLASIGVAVALNKGALSSSLLARATKRASSKPPIITVAARWAPALMQRWHSYQRLERISFILSSAARDEKSGGISRGIVACGSGPSIITARAAIRASFAVFRIA